MATLMQSIARKLDHDTHLFGVINGQKFDLKGGGVGHPYEGSLNTHLDSTTGPVHFPMAILSHIAIMGYPTFSQYQKGCYDLFKISNGYKYTRSLKFSCGGHMETHHTITRTPSGLVGEFEVVEAKFNCPELDQVERLVETFYPAGPGKIQSYFKARWTTKDGSIYSADVNSTYHLNHDITLPFPHFRLVNFDTNHSDTTLAQDEMLLVISDAYDLAKRL